MLIVCSWISNTEWIRHPISNLPFLIWTQLKMLLYAMRETAELNVSIVTDTSAVASINQK
jgi:hypothetical protein